MYLGNDADAACRLPIRRSSAAAASSGFNIEQSELDSTDTCRILFTGETATRKEGIGKAAIVRRVRFPIEQLGRYGCGERDCVSQRARQAAVQGGREGWREGEGARHRRHVHVTPRSHRLSERALISVILIRSLPHCLKIRMHCSISLPLPLTHRISFDVALVRQHRRRHEAAGGAVDLAPCGAVGACPQHATPRSAAGAPSCSACSPSPSSHPLSSLPALSLIFILLSVV